ncbi:cation diffusion facilitator family transporter [Aetokthonos hydrillicola Thurmond2011]|jgi:cation diffusion facilitator family transporter|uniref:Cation diffusion facilitator family transporter n=1 Tax=Aetokthonos hydrillicola Thurmond2011 TaxID=2712845 RepID=A0AAP5MDQ2_9CYAN|nr:cation diffusion facilitator family transporter [Aetokthonos hydrillicola]MBO3458059.1 cation transporter [Aetokthonos hydrillicola CCALA 1050]MBW4587106.1 cation diffusion facilitator family transporter [Aetokthonos hydrillicola CCALA 1050]MDR9899644.1 cation diffusion facilitator family transporter [Aetokthonos hydrillicola Thurmond2011]
MSRQTPRFYGFLSIAAAIVTIALKFGAYLLTGSVGFLSDAIESIVNLVAAVVALWAITYAAKPADAEHAFGHSKAEYFSSGAEGALIVIAAISIAVEAWGRLLHPEPLTQLGLGLALSLVATVVNGVVAFILLRAGRRFRSIILRADAHHLFTDVITSVGVVVGIFLVKLTGSLVLDPIIALLVAVNIVWTGFRLLRETASGLLDAGLPKDELQTISLILSEYERQGIQFHALRTRVAGTRRFVSFHVLVLGSWTVQQGHDVCEAIELAIIQALPLTTVTTHLEPLEDPASWEDQHLDRAK